MLHSEASEGIQTSLDYEAVPTEHSVKQEEPSAHPKVMIDEVEEAEEGILRER